MEKLREEFPPLAAADGSPPVYFDNACMTLRPRAVLEAMDAYYLEHPSCHRRSVHDFGVKTTERYQHARAVVARTIGASRPEEIVFNRNTTEGINQVAYGLNLRAGDAVLTSDFEHNSNLLPWQFLRQRAGIDHRMFEIAAGDEPQEVLARYRTALQGARVKLVSVFHTSHVTGLRLPIREMAELAHAQGALFLCDAAQALLHVELDVAELDVDFMAFSFHKAFGPAGMGALYGKHSLLERLSPLLVGGETVEDVGYDHCIPAAVPERFEAGLQNYPGAMGAASAMEAVARARKLGTFESEHEVFSLLRGELPRLARVRMVGAAGSILNFHVEGVNSGELSRLLNGARRIMVRSGVMCCHAWYRKHSLPTTLRVSLAPYNTLDEASELLRTLSDVTKYF